MKNRKDAWVDRILGGLTLEQKVGQLMVFGFAGPVKSPMVEAFIKRYHVGGLRISQKFSGGVTHKSAAGGSFCADIYDRMNGAKRVSCKPSDYAGVLNELRDVALDRPGSVPLHYTFDQEGEGSDFIFGHRFFPYPMGIVGSGEPELAYQVARATGLQARALGANMIHSPCIDVNTNPRNPEIGPRAYAEDPQTTSQYALESLRGFKETKIVATAKHFPGRGESELDAHFSLPVISLSREELMLKHVAPYQALIAAGLPAVMVCFSAFPALGDDKSPAATSKAIVTELLREELGFEGVVTTDNMEMRGLLDCYSVEDAAVHALNAGCDLLLYRAESLTNLKIIERVIEAVKSGEYPESQLDASVTRILKMRYDMGLHIDGGKVVAANADNSWNAPEILKIGQESAAKTTLLLRDKTSQIPLSENEDILLIEQAHHFHQFINDTNTHPGLLWEEMRKHSDRVGVCLIDEKFSEDDKAAAFERARTAQRIVVTSYYNYRSHATMVEFIRELLALNKSVVVVANTPYARFAVPDEAETVVVSFCPTMREQLAFVADVIFGKQKATATFAGSIS